MTILLDLLYFLATPIAFPFLVIKSLRTGKYRSGWPARFGRGDPILSKRTPDQKVLLLHCVSVGELLSVQTLLQKLLAADSTLHIAISTGTDTGTTRAHALFPPNDLKWAGNPRVHPVRYPLDFSFAIESLLDRVQPDAIALVELETWPNFLALAQSRRIPVVLINGRISEKSFPRYRLIAPVMRAMLRKIAWIGAQTPAIADRFRALGAANVEVIPTLKYDNAPTSTTAPGQDQLAAAMGLLPQHKLLVAGSTGPGEEDPILDTYLALCQQFTDLRLAIVPRHPEVVSQVLSAIKKRNLTPIRRTERPDSLNPKPYSLDPSSVFVLDTMGELRKMYALAFAVFVGRSLVKLGGSDMIEVAAMGKPCSFGPYTSNFAEAVELLLQEKAAALVHNAPELTTLFREWLANPQAAQAMGHHARAVINRQRGSTDKYVNVLLDLLKNRPAASAK